MIKAPLPPYQKSWLKEWPCRGPAVTSLDGGGLFDDPLPSSGFSAGLITYHPQKNCDCGKDEHCPMRAGDACSLVRGGSKATGMLSKECECKALANLDSMVLNGVCMLGNAWKDIL